LSLLHILLKSLFSQREKICESGSVGGEPRFFLFLRIFCAGNNEEKNEKDTLGPVSVKMRSHEKMNYPEAELRGIFLIKKVVK